MTDVTRILNAIERGDAKAADELLPLVYEELRRLAQYKLSHEKPGQTLQATALVHEAYIRLVEGVGQNWSEKRHFFQAAAEAMRRILVDKARRKNTLRYGGKRQRMNFEGRDLAINELPDELLAVDDALAELAESDELKAELVKLRYFAGLTLEETAKALDISPTTAKRHWRFARAWLRKRIDADL